MRILPLVFLFSVIATSSFGADEKKGGPVFQASGTTSEGVPFTSKSGYVEGSEAKVVGEAALTVLGNSKGKQELVISSDNPNSENYKSLEPLINKFPDTPRFLFIDGGSKFTGEETFDRLKEKSIETLNVIKKDPGGIFFFFLTTAISTRLYLHFVEHPNVFSAGVPILATLISNALFVKPSLWFPLDNLKNKIDSLKSKTTDIAKDKEGKIGEVLGINTQTPGFKNFQEGSVAVGGYTSVTVVFENATRAIPSGWRILAFQGAAIRDGFFSGLGITSFSLAVRKWQRSANPPLSAEGIDWFIRAQRFAMAIYLPHLYAAKDVIGVVGMVAMTTTGLLAYFYGSPIINYIKERPLIINGSQVFADLRDSFKQAYQDQDKPITEKTRAALCNFWLSLRK